MRVFFYFTVPNNDELLYSLSIPEIYGVSEKFSQSLNCTIYFDLRNIFEKNGQEPFGTCEFDFTIGGS